MPVIMLKISDESFIVRSGIVEVEKLRQITEAEGKVNANAVKFTIKDNGEIKTCHPGSLLFSGTVSDFIAKKAGKDTYNVLTKIIYRENGWPPLYEKANFEEIFGSIADMNLIEG